MSEQNALARPPLPFRLFQGFLRPEILERALESGRPIIFQTAHYGNWELGNLAFAARFVPVHVVGHPLDWAWADRILTPPPGNSSASALSSGNGR
jgi:hypothetical protein